MENDARNLMDADGENMAVRYFLYGYQMGVNRFDGMREHLANFGLPYWPDWAATESGHITKTEAQNWLRYLFSLEGASEVERLRSELAECRQDAARLREYRDVLELVASPLHINGDDHAAVVKLARAALATGKDSLPVDPAATAHAELAECRHPLRAPNAALTGHRPKE